MFVPLAVLKCGLEKITDRAARRYVLDAVHLSRDQEGRPWAAATDGRRLVAVSWEEPDPDEMPAVPWCDTATRRPGFEAIVPLDIWAELGRLPLAKSPRQALTHVAIQEAHADDWQIALAHRIDSFVTLAFRQPEGRYPNWLGIVQTCRTSCQDHGTVCVNPALLGQLASVVAKAAGDSEESLRIEPPTEQGYVLMEMNGERYVVAVLAVMKNIESGIDDDDGSYETVASDAEQHASEPCAAV